MSDQSRPLLPVNTVKAAPPKRRKRRKKHNEPELINEILGKPEQRAESELSLFLEHAPHGYLRVIYTCTTCDALAVMIGATYSPKFCSYCQRSMKVETKKVL